MLAHIRHSLECCCRQDGSGFAAFPSDVTKRSFLEERSAFLRLSELDLACASKFFRAISALRLSETVRGPKLLLTAYSGSIQPEDAREILFLGFRDGGTCEVVGRLSRQRNARASPWFATARRADTDSRR
jgi:hypothetical protein